MQIGAISFHPYIYNTNAISGSSLSKISSIGDDLLTSKTDYSSLADESLNENPLKKGQTSDFSSILDRQLSMGRRNASRLVKPREEMPEFPAAEERQAEETDTGRFAGRTQENFQMQGERNLFRMQQAVQAYQMNMMM